MPSTLPITKQIKRTDRITLRIIVIMLAMPIGLLVASGLVFVLAERKLNPELKPCTPAIIEVIAADNLVVDIAARSGFSSSDIKRFNNLSDKDLLSLQAGTPIRVPCR